MKNDFCAKIPGKAFVLGEHLVLSGSPAWVTTPGARFSLRVSGEWMSRDPGSHFPFHPQSPAGRLLMWALARSFLIPQVWTWDDPYQGAGGMGGSTAEFALVYRLLAVQNPLDLNWQSVWRLYRELTLGRPSGADLVAQWVGGTIRFDGSGQLPKVSPVVFQEFPVQWFLASHLPGRKIQTHLHLAAGALPRVNLAPDQNLSRAIREFVDALSSAGLEHPETRRDRLEFSKIPGVLVAKGCGAHMADVLMVVIDPVRAAEAREAVLRVGQKLGLKPIEGGLRGQPGVQLYAHESDRRSSPL